MHLQPRISHPGLTRSLTVSLIDLDSDCAKDKLSGKELSQFLLDEMLADPMVRLVMQADDVSESQLRHLYSGSCKSQYNRDVLDQKPMRQSPRDDLSIQAAENEGMPTWAD